MKKQIFIGMLNPSVILTYVGVVLSVTAMGVAICGNIPAAMILFMLSGICDLFDGRFARLFKRDREALLFGVQIDSLADMINFIALPIVLLLTMGLNHPWHYAIYGVYALCGITRLAFFNIRDDAAGETPQYYSGLPVTYAALVIPAVHLITRYVPSAVGPVALPGCMALLAITFVLNIRIRKPRGVAYLFFLLLAALMITLTLMTGA